MSFVQVIDESGFCVGTLAQSLVNDFNRDVVVDVALPSEPLGDMKGWRWSGSSWQQVTDFRLGSWYNPLNTDEVHRPASFDDAPPDGWTKWEPGQNKVVSQDEVLRKAAARARAKRDTLLAESDWTDTLSAKTRLGDALYNAWQDYRQILRDVPQQPGFPTDIAWPVAPT